MLLNHRYQVVRLLGEGGFGKTFLAEDRQMPSSRSCVIKQLKPIAPTVTSTILPQESGLNTELGTMMMAPSQPQSTVPQPSRSPVLLGSLITGGLISAAILAGFFLTRSPQFEQFSSNSPTPVSTPSNQSPDASPAPIASNSPTPASPSPAIEDKSQPIPPQTFILKATSTGGQVNIYAAPSSQSNSPHYGLDGDRVTASRQTQDNEGSLWYFVQFASGAAGWVRSDLVQSVSSAPKPNVPQPGENTATFPQTATLTGTAPGSRVNVRSAPSTQADSPSYGLVGDRVTVLEQTQSAEGDLWYRVRFASGAEGWVRGDFVQLP